MEKQESKAEETCAHGKAKGIAKSEATGSENKNIENVKKFTELGASVDTIAQATGLPVEVIN